MFIETTIVDGIPFKSFTTRFVTMNGQPYEIIECGKNGSFWYQVLKNKRGETKEFEHDQLAAILEKEIVPAIIEPTQIVPALDNTTQLFIFDL